jgi:hypothetical protein
VQKMMVEKIWEIEEKQVKMGDFLLRPYFIHRDWP